MVNFKQIVIESLLLEGYSSTEFGTVGKWFGDAINKYNAAFNVNIDNEKTIKSFYDAVKQDPIPTNNPDLYPNVNFLNIMCFMVDTLALSATKYDNFVNAIKSKPNIEEATSGKVKINDVDNKTSFGNINHHPKITKYLQSLQTRGADALVSEYGNNFVIVAVQQIVKKRIDFFTRLSKLKSPTAPFTNLIYDVFRYPLEYKSGAKKYTSDFKEVDQFYIRDLIDIALAARNFYGVEIANLKTAGVSVPDAIRKNIIDTQISNNSNSVANKINFLSGQPMKYKKVDATGKDVDPEEELENKNYTVNAIMKIKTPEAQKLVGLLSKFAEYERTKPGAGERLQYATQAASALVGFGGGKLYG